MIRIVIVEDDENVINQLKRYFARYEEDRGMAFSIKSYTRPEDFLNEYDGADIVMMDINMPQMNGLTAAKKLRERDATVSIVFVTYLEKYAVNGYEVNALDFIVKPLNYESFSIKLERILRLLPHEHNDRILIKTAVGVATVYVKDIFYIEVADHSLFFHTKQEIYKSRGSIKEQEEMLSHRDFVLCNKCYLINLAWVDYVENYTVVVAGESLTISRPKKKDFMKSLTEYYSGRRVNTGDKL